MTTRTASDFAADDQGQEQPRNQRQRIHENPPASLASLNDDCLLLVLSYLSADDLNSAACCSRLFRKARAHQSLDQARAGTIVISQGGTYQSLLHSIRTNDWNQVFQGNRTRLKMEGLGRLLSSDRLASPPDPLWDYQLEEVTSLDLSFLPSDATGDQRLDYALLFGLFPSVTSIDLTSMPLWRRCFKVMNDRLPNVTTVTLNNCATDGLLYLCGHNIWDLPHHLVNLFLDDCRFFFRMGQARRMVEDADQDIFPFCHLRSLERLSIKNATCRFPTGVQPMPQEALIKLVRLHPTLRWLRSDLSAENVAMLQEERPEITFV